MPAVLNVFNDSLTYKLRVLWRPHNSVEHTHFTSGYFIYWKKEEMQNHTQMISKSSYLVLVHGITDLINMSTGFFFFFICSEFCHTLEWNSHGFTDLADPSMSISGSVYRLDGYSIVKFSVPQVSLAGTAVSLPDTDFLVPILIHSFKLFLYFHIRSFWIESLTLH